MKTIVHLLIASAIWLALPITGFTGVSLSAHNRATAPRFKMPHDRMGIDMVRTRTAAFAMGDYIQAHHEHFPKAAHWEEAIRPYWDKQIPFNVTLLTPPGAKPRRLAMNKNLSGLNRDRLARPDQVIMLYEVASSTRDASGDPAHAPHISIKQYDGRQWVICFCDDRLNLY